MPLHLKANQAMPRYHKCGPDDTRDCRYCGKPVTATDYSEGGAPDYSVAYHHFHTCWHSKKLGGRYAVLWSAADQNRHEYGYDNLLRAKDDAAYLLTHNAGTVFVVYDTVAQAVEFVTTNAKG